jgi:hypothetical protein
VRPGLVAGESPLSTYLYPWYNWRYQVNGNLYWRTTLWGEDTCSSNGSCAANYKELSRFFTSDNYSSWHCFRSEPQNLCSGFTNLNATLSYPGYDTTTDQPYFVGSLRLEYLKNGIEDYDYFALLQFAARNFHDRTAQKLLDTVEQSGELIGNDKVSEKLWDISKAIDIPVEQFLNYRRMIGEHLSGLKLPKDWQKQLRGRQAPLRQPHCYRNPEINSL